MTVKIFVLASDAPSLVNFRGPLLTALMAAGHSVSVAAPMLLPESPTARTLKKMGIPSYDFSLSRTGMNPVADFAMAVSLFRLMRKIRPDVVLSYTIKPVIWGTLAAWIARVPRRYALITGLGYAFTGRATGKRLIIQRIARWLYKCALARATKVFFQNPDDAALFKNLGLVPGHVPIVVVNGSGVDTAHFAPVPLPKGPMSFLLIARLLGDKGIREYVQAASIIRRNHPTVRFDLVGGLDTNPDTIALAEVERWHALGDIIWHGPLDDVRPAIAAAHVYVLPSYREGTPRTVLEAMSMGRAVITTDAPGCRETVVEGINGFLVPVRDEVALANAMKRFIDRQDLVVEMGLTSRRIAEDKYDVHKVNAVMLAEMGL